MKDPDNELPRMDSLDIGARLVGARPGDIVYIQRHSDTIGQAYVFRRVVKDANVDQ
jgi:DNA-directed RNA polymerase subunit H (RpoH/RPB5)